MRTGLLSDLSVIGYEILLEGEIIRLRYQKPDTPPESARPLIDELRRCKAEAVRLLKMGTNTISADIFRPRAIGSTAWPADVKPLVDWFLKLELPVKPFYLEAHQYIVDPAKFFESLGQEIQSGPKGPRARMGTLQSDLWKLKASLN